MEQDMIEQQDAAFYVGQRFSTFKDLENFVQNYCNINYTKLWKRDTRTVKSVRGKKIHRPLSDKIVYYEIKYACIHGGLKFTSESKGIRESSTFKVDCPMHIRLRASSDGENLEVISYVPDHNHERMTRLMYKHINRRPDGVKASTSKKLLLLKANKKYQQLLTKYAFSCLIKQLKASANLDVSADDNKMVTLDSCGCRFYRSMLLPCRHIFALRRSKNVDLYEPSLCNQRWARNHYHSSQSFLAAPLPKMGAIASLNEPEKNILTCAQKRRKVELLTEKMVNVVCLASGVHFQRKIEVLTHLLEIWEKGGDVAVSAVDADSALAEATKSRQNESIPAEISEEHETDFEIMPMVKQENDLAEQNENMPEEISEEQETDFNEIMPVIKQENNSSEQYENMPEEISEENGTDFNGKMCMVKQEKDLSEENENMPEEISEEQATDFNEKMPIVKDENDLSEQNEALPEEISEEQQTDFNEKMPMVKQEKDFIENMTEELQDMKMPNVIQKQRQPKGHDHTVIGIDTHFSCPRITLTSPSLAIISPHPPSPAIISPHLLSPSLAIISPHSPSRSLTLISPQSSSPSLAIISSHSPSPDGL